MSEQKLNRQPTPPVTSDPWAPELQRRHWEEIVWFRNQPENSERYGGRVVVLYHRELLAEGSDRAEALARARAVLAERGLAHLPRYELTEIEVPAEWEPVPEEWITGRPGLPPAVYDPENADYMRRQRGDHDWFLSQPENWERHLGEVVVLYQREVFGAGRGVEKALDQAKATLAQRGGTPDLWRELVVVVFPDPWGGLREVPEPA